MSAELVPVGAEGANVAVTPAGAFRSERVTAPEKFVRVIAMAEVAFSPCAIVNAAGEAESW